MRKKRYNVFQNAFVRLSKGIIMRKKGVITPFKRRNNSKLCVITPFKRSNNAKLCVITPFKRRNNAKHCVITPFKMRLYAFFGVETLF